MAHYTHHFTVGSTSRRSYRNDAIQTIEAIVSVGEGSRQWLELIHPATNQTTSPSKVRKVVLDIPLEVTDMQSLLVLFLPQYYKVDMTQLENFLKESRVVLTKEDIQQIRVLDAKVNDDMIIVVSDLV